MAHALVIEFLSEAPSQPRHLEPLAKELFAPAGDWAVDAVIAAMRLRPDVDLAEAQTTARLAVHRAHKAARDAVQRHDRPRRARTAVGSARPSLDRFIEALPDTLTDLLSLERNLVAYGRDASPLHGRLVAFLEAAIALGDPRPELEQLAAGSPGRPLAPYADAFAAVLASAWRYLTGKRPSGTVTEGVRRRGSCPNFADFVRAAAADAGFKGELKDAIRQVVKDRRQRRPAER
jgi:hypothetical protein